MKRFLGFTFVAFVLFSLGLYGLVGGESADAHVPSANGNNCAGPGRDCVGANYLVGKALRFTSSGTVGNTVMSIPQDQRICLNYPSCDRYLQCNPNTGCTFVNEALAITQGMSISWGLGIGLISQGATNGLMLNTVGAQSALQPMVQAMISHDVASTANTAGTETTLSSTTIKANALNVNGRGFRFTMNGATAANANVKTIKVKVGSTDLTSGVISAAYNNVQFRIVGECSRTAATTLICAVQYFFGATNAVIQAAPTQDTTADFTISYTGNGAGAADVFNRYTYIEFLP